eukprot:g5142.t1
MYICAQQDSKYARFRWHRDTEQGINHVLTFVFMLSKETNSSMQIAGYNEIEYQNAGSGLVFPSDTEHRSGRADKGTMKIALFFGKLLSTKRIKEASRLLINSRIKKIKNSSSAWYLSYEWEGCVCTHLHHIRHNNDVKTIHTSETKRNQLENKKMDTTDPTNNKIEADTINDIGNTITPLKVSSDHDFDGIWVQCDNCNRWCHRKCTGLTRKEAATVSWTCPTCIEPSCWCNKLVHQEGYGEFDGHWIGCDICGRFSHRVCTNISVESMENAKYTCPRCKIPERGNDADESEDTVHGGGTDNSIPHGEAYYIKNLMDFLLGTRTTQDGGGNSKDEIIVSEQESIESESEEDNSFNVQQTTNEFFDKEILLKDFLGYDGGEGSFLFGNNLTKEFVQTKDIIENHVSRGRSRARSDIPDFSSHLFSNDCGGSRNRVHSINSVDNDTTVNSVEK